MRSLLARVTSLALPPKKMKGFFRWVTKTTGWGVRRGRGSVHGGISAQCVPVHGVGLVCFLLRKCSELPSDANNNIYAMLNLQHVDKLLQLEGTSDTVCTVSCLPYLWLCVKCVNPLCHSGPCSMCMRDLRMLASHQTTKSMVLNICCCCCCCRRWLEYEEAHGTAADVEGVKQRAMDYMRAQETA